ncbi:hypothetical protein AGABI1DRAFT_126429 [Agaricus bisporus var. burnettii JB137-S8]|uniref:Uncharacterized protein n=1 Tax=Agaricus bisporus var. burnettii (strain JB137-S8 / ATCC MYA-4627 / FGSC 10392) TaxID=597362 RepID=K5Y2J5_AGABU|nr:uncharacterized protein AGABI1DRAFT_126429 [Agaricus bisporus var. burnettii JB137-S8]EKM82080.1 hypothetical protein AGABI1DRAFT_126429 [Agaricus bisporus var. burnettii JB137-S8]
MASQQPVVCTSLHLPPDLRPFLRIHEISLTVFLPNLDRLRLSLKAGQDINPEATKIFTETRKGLTFELYGVFRVLYIAQTVALQYFRVLEALSEGKSTQDPLYNVYADAFWGKRISEWAQEAMTTFRRELESAVSRVAATLNTTNSRTSLTSPENIESVLEILSAIDECHVSLQQCHRQFARLEIQTKDKKSVDSNPPSEEETQVMFDKWKTYFDNIKGVYMHGNKIADEILMPSRDNHQDASKVHKSRTKVPLWRTFFQRQDKRDLFHSTDILRAPSDPEAISVPSPNGSHELQANMMTPASNLADGPITSGITDGTEYPDAIPSNGPSPKIPLRKRLLLFLMPTFIV